MDLNSWLCWNEMDNLMAINKGRCNYYPDIGVAPCESLGHPSLTNPFKDLCDFSTDAERWIAAQRFCDTFSFRKDFIPFVCFLEVKLDVRSQFGTPRYNFINGRWVRNHNTPNKDGLLLTKYLNKTEIVESTHEFLLSQKQENKDLICYKKTTGSNVVPIQSLVDTSNKTKYIVDKVLLPSTEIADIIESYYKDGKEAPSDYIFIGGKGLYKLSDKDYWNLEVPRFRDAVNKTSLGSLAIRYIIRSRGCYEIVPEITLGDDESLAQSNFLGF